MLLAFYSENIHAHCEAFKVWDPLALESIDLFLESKGFGFHLKTPKLYLISFLIENFLNEFYILLYSLDLASYFGSFLLILSKDLVIVLLEL